MIIALEMKKPSILDLVLTSRNQIIHEFLNTSGYSLGASLGYLKDIAYSEGVMLFKFEKGEIRLEIDIVKLLHFLEKSVKNNGVKNVS